MENTDYSTSYLVVGTGGPSYLRLDPSLPSFGLLPLPAVRRSDRLYPAGSGGTRSVCVKSIAYGIWDGVHIRLEDGRPVAYEPDVDGILVRTPEQPVRVQVKRRRGADGTLGFVVGYRYRGEIRWVRTWEGALVIRKRPPALPSKDSLAEVARLMSDHVARVLDILEQSAPGRDRRR